MPDANPTSRMSTGQRAGAEALRVGAIFTGDATHPSLAALRESLAGLASLRARTSIWKHASMGDSSIGSPILRRSWSHSDPT
jgi:hypothetical protein